VFVNPALGGTGIFDYGTNAVAAFDAKAQFVSQLWAVGTSLVWSGVVAFVLFKLIDWTIGLRVSEEAEREGLDVSGHGEKAYNL
jgi:Amt family ammonium transporter